MKKLMWGVAIVVVLYIGYVVINGYHEVNLATEQQEKGWGPVESLKNSGASSVQAGSSIR